MNRMIFPAVLAAALVSSLLHSGHSLRAEEPNCQRCEASVPILSKIPYLGRLFKNVAVGECQDNVERIGVDFDFQVCEDNCLPAPVVNAQCVSGRSQNSQFKTVTFTIPEVTSRTCSGPACTESVCTGPACPATNLTAASPCAKGECAGPAGCPDAVCSAAACAGCPSSVCAPPPGFVGMGPPPHALLAEVAMQSNMLQMYGEFLQEIDSLREKLSDEKQELTEALIETSVENAKLTAQLEATKETTKLAIENAVLKERLAVAQGQTPGNQQLAKKLAKKNAALQAKVEKLEKQVTAFTKAKLEVAEKTNVKKK